MFYIEKFFLVISIWVFLGASSVFAHPHHHGEQLDHQHEDFSPFGRKIQSLHCLLRGHDYSSICPHTKSAKGQSAPVALTRNCGRKASGSVPKITSFNNDFVETGLYFLNQNWPEEKLPLSGSTQLQCFTDSLDPPPIRI